MKKDANVTDIVFRKENSGDFKGTIFALFPHECSDAKGNVTSYQHVGQHSSANYAQCICSSKPATIGESRELKKEMANRGYNINVIQRRNYDKFLKSLNEVRKNLR
jgi:hypothetical protein